jgi:hypothetical protein
MDGFGLGELVGVARGIGLAEGRKNLSRLEQGWMKSCEIESQTVESRVDRAQRGDVR